jgi:hypothetical protein
MTTLLTNTALTTFRLCPRKYRNRYVLGLARARLATPLRFGQAFHLGLEQQALGLDEELAVAQAIAGYDSCPDWADPADWDPSKILQLQWQAAASVDFEITLDDVAFYK